MEILIGPYPALPPRPPYVPDVSSTFAPWPVSSDDIGEILGIVLGIAVGEFTLLGVLFIGIMVVCIFNSHCPLYRKRRHYQEMN